MLTVGLRAKLCKSRFRLIRFTRFSLFLKTLNQAIINTLVSPRSVALSVARGLDLILSMSGVMLDLLQHAVGKSPERIYEAQNRFKNISLSN